MAVLTGSPSSTSIDQNAHITPSNSHTIQETQTPIISHNVEEENHDIEVAHMCNDPYFGILIPEVAPDQFSSSDVIYIIVPPGHQVSEHNSTSTKNYKDALTQACWIEAMQEELHEFECLKVWELVPPLDKALVITLKWIYKVKLDELGVILKNKAQLVARGYRQEEGSDLKIPSLGLRFLKSQRHLFINQSKYALESLKKYGFESCDPVDTPMVEKSKLDDDKEGKAVDPSHYRGMIGTLLYLTASRPDLQFAICMCARYQARPTEKNLNAVKMIFRYLKGTVPTGPLVSREDSSIALTTFAYADHAGCQDTRRSTSDSIQLLGDRLVSWSSKRQKSIAISSTKAEYIAFSGCCAQVLLMRSQLTDYGFGFINSNFVNTEYQLADIFTKALGRERIEFLISKLGMRSYTPETLKKLADDVDE
ncbi:hypothetical protein Tco_0439612 [Tanacetum coccineum]